MPTEELVYYVERSKKGVERNRLALHCIERRLALRPGEVPAADGILAQPRFGYLKDKTPAELTALQNFAQQALKRYEEALRLAAAVLGERSVGGGGRPEVRLRASPISAGCNSEAYWACLA